MRKLGKIADDLCLFGQLGILSPPFGEERPDFPIMLKVIPDIDTFMGIEGHFALGLFQGRTDIDDAAEGRTRFRLHAADGFFRIGQVLFNDIASFTGLRRRAISLDNRDGARRTSMFWTW